MCFNEKENVWLVSELGSAGLTWDQLIQRRAAFPLLFPGLCHRISAFSTAGNVVTPPVWKIRPRCMWRLLTFCFAGVFGAERWSLSTPEAVCVHHQSPAMIWSNSMFKSPAWTFFELLPSDSGCILAHKFLSKQKRMCGWSVYLQEGCKQKTSLWLGGPRKTSLFINQRQMVLLFLTDKEVQINTALTGDHFQWQLKTSLVL